MSSHLQMMLDPTLKKKTLDHLSNTMRDFKNNLSQDDIHFMSIFEKYSHKSMVEFLKNPVLKELYAHFAENGAK